MYAKVFTQILDSSIAEHWQTRLVFEDMLKLSDLNGVVDMTHESIARRTNVPLEIVRAGITELEKPDTRSRNPEHEGKRIVRLDEHRDWGWIIVNYAHYRNLVSADQKREKTRCRVQNFRAKRNADVKSCNADTVTVTPANASNAMQRQREKQMQSKGEVNIRPILKLTERISFEREITAIGSELTKLGKASDYDKGSKNHERILKLISRQSELRELLGVVA